MAHGRESKAIALRAARASIEANITALELAAGLLAEGIASPRHRVAIHPIESTSTQARPIGTLATVRAIG